MTNRLIGMIRAERNRQSSPAVVALELDGYRHRHGSGIRGRVLQRIRRPIGLLIQMLARTLALSLLNSPRVVLAKSNHKFQEVYEALVRNGLDEKNIEFIFRANGVHFIRYIFTGKLCIFRNVLDWVYLNWRMRGRGQDYLNVVCLYCVCLRQIQTLGMNYWICVGDLSSWQIALATAARHAGHQVIYWQQDYLDFKRFPIEADIGIVLNQAGRQLAGINDLRGTQNRLFWRHAIYQSEIQLQRAKVAPIGVLLNAFVEEETLIARLSQINEAFRKSVVVRLHPNSEIGEGKLPRKVEVQQKNASLEEFVEKVGLIVCGNTSAQLKALCLGAPIVLTAGLDPLPYDHHGYVSRGVVFGVRDIGSASMQSIVDFYSSGSYLAAASRLLGPPAEKRRPNLRDFCELIGREL